MQNIFMDLERYHYYTNNDFQQYEFYSEGPKGKIKKVVIFQQAQENPLIFNLAFGDEDPVTKQVNDSVATNNDDRNKVLITVASTINDFCDRYGNHYIYAEGSDSVRTRLYQISISQLLEEITIDFDVYGVKDKKTSSLKKTLTMMGF